MNLAGTNTWERRLGELADKLTASGKLRSSRWQQVFRSVPRHVLVPEYYQQNGEGTWKRLRTDEGEGFDAVYSNRALFTDVDERGHGVSSSSMPGLMTRMLELLDVHPGHRVLEIGTGTGYNAALLTAYLGDENVFSIDIDYVDDARDRLASLDYHPTLAVRDGIEGLPEHAPYDRLISTVAVSTVPYTWVEQVRNGGLILADVKVGISSGNLVLLRKEGPTAVGRFDTGYAAFMGMRHPGRRPLTSTAPRAAEDEAEQRTTDVPAFAWEQAVPWFLAGIGLPADTVYGKRFDDSGKESAGTLFSDDGSWAAITVDADKHGRRTVMQAGPTKLWDMVEIGYRQWQDTGCPGWNRFGMTVTADEQTVWLDAPDSVHRWSLECPAAW